MEQAGIQLIAQGINVYLGDMKSATSATNTFVDSTDKGSGRVSAAGQVMIGGLRKVGEVVVDVFGQALKATAAFVSGSVNLAGDFEANMKDVQIAVGDGFDTKQINLFRDDFLQIGKDLPVSTSDVQQAFISLVKGGVDPMALHMGALRESVQFATAAELDQVAAADLSAKQLGIWTDATATATEQNDFLIMSHDLLVRAANASTVGVADLAAAENVAGGIARALNIDYRDFSVTLAEIAPGFNSTVEAGTAYKNFLARIQPTTQPAIDAMQALGLYTKEGGSAFFDATGNYVGNRQAAELLMQATKDLTAEQRALMLQTIFGNDAMGAAVKLATDGAAGYDAMSAKIDAASGVSEAAALKQQGFNTALDNTKGSVEALQIQLGSHLLPILGDVLDNYITPGINAFSDWADAILSADAPIQALITSIDQLMPGFQSFVDTAEIVGAFIGDNLMPILFGLGTAIAVAVVPPLLTATGAFLAAAAPIVALVAAGALLYKAWETDFLGIKTTVTQVWTDTLLPAFKDIQSWLAEKIPPAIKTLAGFWTDTLQPALKVVWGFLNDKVFPVLADLTDIYIAAAIIEVKALAALWTGVLQPSLKVVWDFISGSVIPIFKALFEVNWAIATKAVEAMAGLWQKVLQPAFKTVSDFVTASVVPALTSIGDYLNQTFGPTLASTKKWLSDITGGFAGVTGGVKEVVTWLGNLATSISTLKLPDWLTPGSPTPLETGLRGIGAALAQSVLPNLTPFQQGVKDIGTAITDSFANTDIVDMLKNLGKDAMAGFGKGLKAGLSGVMSIVDSAANTVEDAFKDAFKSHSPSERMVPVGESIPEGIMQGVIAMWPALMDEVSSLSDDLIDQVGDIGQQINGIIADSFGATASIDRQVAANLDRMKDVLPQNQIHYQDQLNRAQKEAEAFLDPAAGAKYFQMRSKQILETAKLEKEASEATTAEDRARIEAKLLLINRAHEAEIAQFNANQQADGNPYQSIIDQISALFAAGLPVNDTGLGHDLMLLLNRLLGIPGYASGGQVNAGQPYWVGEQGPELFWPQMNGMVSPAASSQQMAARGNQTNYNGQVGNTYNMPVYTNNSQGAIQQSWAVMQASMA